MSTKKITSSCFCTGKPEVVYERMSTSHKDSFGGGYAPRQADVKKYTKEEKKNEMLYFCKGKSQDSEKTGY